MCWDTTQEKAACRASRLLAVTGLWTCAPSAGIQRASLQVPEMQGSELIISTHTRSSLCRAGRRRAALQPFQLRAPRAQSSEEAVLCTRAPQASAPPANRATVGDVPSEIVATAGACTQGPRPSNSAFKDHRALTADDDSIFDMRAQSGPEYATLKFQAVQDQIVH